MIKALKQSFTALIFLLLFSACNTGVRSQAPSKSAVEVDQKKLRKDESERDRFISKLLSEMTIEEKAGQLNLISVDMTITGPSSNSPNNPRILQEIEEGKIGLIFNAYDANFACQMQEASEKSPHKIPVMIGHDVIHGHRTIFPIPLAESATWNLDLIQKSARLATKEATLDGINWTFGPMVDIARDPRWGRILEGAGEDTWLGSKIAAARVKGIQGISLYAKDSNLACVKHFAAYGAALGGQDYGSANISELELVERYLPPFKAALDAGAGSIMASFNTINKVPSTANKKLLGKILRDEWGFDGLVTTDYTAIKELINHTIAVNHEEAALKAFLAGSEVDMQGGAGTDPIGGTGYLKYLPQFIEKGLVDEAALDLAVRHVLEAKYKLGLFENRYKNCARSESEKAQVAKGMMSPEHMDHASDVARRSVVLLQNEKEALPLNAVGATVALIGPLADNKRDQLGSWSSAGDWRKAVSLKEGMENFVEARKKGIEASGKTPVTLLYSKGANILEDDNPDDKEMRAKLNSDGGNVDLDKKSSDQLLAEALEVAKKADTTVLALGESQGMSGEAASRMSLRIPGNQRRLLEKIRELYKGTNKKIVLVVYSGRPLVLTDESRLADSILEAWFLGTQAGNALADVLFGAHNPSGKLTASFPYHEGQILAHNYDQENTGRPELIGFKYEHKYLDGRSEALFPFGWGLSYTTFDYTELKLSTKKMNLDGTLQVSVKVTNTGTRSGEETAQLYLRDLNGSLSRPLKELRGFKKVFLEPGKSEVVTFNLTVDDLKFYVEESPGNFSKIFEKGEYSVFVSGSSRALVDEVATVKAKEKATVEETLKAKAKGSELGDWEKKIIEKIRVYKEAIFVLE